MLIVFMSCHLDNSSAVTVTSIARDLYVFCVCLRRCSYINVEVVAVVVIIRAVFNGGNMGQVYSNDLRATPSGPEECIFHVFSNRFSFDFR